MLRTLIVALIAFLPMSHAFAIDGITSRPSPHSVPETVRKLEAVLAERAQGLVPTSTLAELVAALTPPRRILLMITAGRPVDLVMDALLPLLTPGDIVIDGGNSWFEDTRRREASAREHGIAFVGMGVSGGEDGARFGPSLMPGGSAEAYAHLAPILEAIAAKQAHETYMIKNVITKFRDLVPAEAKDDPEVAAAYKVIQTKVGGKLYEKHAALTAEVQKQLVPVKHTITVTPVK